MRGFEYLRFAEEDKPAAGGFDGWPENVSEVTVMDPCCGSGHFLVEAFSMLWQMRAEEEGLSPVEAQDAVLRDNLFGLELDPRCVQIAMFAVVLQAWKAGGGWRQLPVPNIACSGHPGESAGRRVDGLAGGDERLADALARLHDFFRDADTLGSLIDPRRTTEATDSAGRQGSFEDVDWEEVALAVARGGSKRAHRPRLWLPSSRRALRWRRAADLLVAVIYAGVDERSRLKRGAQERTDEFLRVPLLGCARGSGNCLPGSVRTSQ